MALCATFNRNYENMAVGGIITEKVVCSVPSYEDKGGFTSNNIQTAQKCVFQTENVDTCNVKEILNENRTIATHSGNNVDCANDVIVNVTETVELHEEKKGNNEVEFRVEEQLLRENSELCREIEKVLKLADDTDPYIEPMLLSGRRENSPIDDSSRMSLTMFTRTPRTELGLTTCTFPELDFTMNSTATSPFTRMEVTSGSRKAQWSGRKRASQGVTWNKHVDVIREPKKLFSFKEAPLNDRQLTAASSEIDLCLQQDGLSEEPYSRFESLIVHHV